MQGVQIVPAVGHLPGVADQAVGADDADVEADTELVLLLAR